MYRTQAQYDRSHALLTLELSPVASVAFGGDLLAMADVWIQWWRWRYENQTDCIYELICDGWMVKIEASRQCNGRWSLLMWQVWTQSCYILQWQMVGANSASTHKVVRSLKKWSIRVGTVVCKWPQIEHNSTTAQAERERKITMY